MNIIILLCCLSSFNPAHVTYGGDYVPGSISVDYTGIKKVIINETVKFLSSEWNNRTGILYNSGQITYNQYTSSLKHMAIAMEESRIIGKWWERDWWHSLPPDKGGIHKPKHYVVGRTGDFIDLGFVHLTQDFKLKLKSYRKNLNPKWKFKFKPHVTISTSKWIRNATATFSLTYYRKGIRRFRFVLTAGYKRDLKEFVQLTIEMLNI